MDSKEYLEFLKKFETKKTTDDCYTPPVIYDAVLNWCEKEYGINKKDVVRPFYPGGDYESYDYQDGAVVIDNPPFSIITKICRFYKEKGIKFFLFAPHLTLMGVKPFELCRIVTNSLITFENGAKVEIGFITNLEEGIYAKTAPKLKQILDSLGNVLKQTKTLPKYKYPDCLITVSVLSKLVKAGVDFKIPLKECCVVKQMDSQKEKRKAVYGAGIFVSERIAQERIAQERIAQERIAQERIAQERIAQERIAQERIARERIAREKQNHKKAIDWALSEREIEIVKGLGEGIR